MFGSKSQKRSGRDARGAAFSGQHGLDLDDGWSPMKKPAFDWKKALLLLGLGTLSWISTYTGMLELIQANMGKVDLGVMIAIGFAVAMLMLMIVWLLDRLFDRIPFLTRTLFVGGYIFLTVISVGFGFGFYWKYLESRSEASRSAESAVGQVQTALVSAQTRLEQLETTLASLTAISAAKAVAEREKGNSCPNSSPGDGPRRRLRDADASRFGFAGNFVSQRATTVRGDITALNGDLALVSTQDASTFDAVDGTRNNFLRGLSQKLDQSVARFNAFRTDPQLMQIRQEFGERSGQTVFPNGRGGTFSCPDAELQSALRGVVRAIDQLPQLEKPQIKAVEGSEAIIEAFRRLTSTLSGILVLKLPPSPDEIRTLQEQAVQSVNTTAAQQRQLQTLTAGLGDRDYVPLFIAIFVDFCLLLVSVSRPMNGFNWLDHRMGEAQDWPVIKILSRFRDIHQDDEIRETFDMFRHVVFDWRGVYYAAIPVNGTDPTYENKMSRDAAIQAQLLSNLFTSFENEKVFTRTPVTFFTTSFLQKKLREQGSRFSDCEAFRIYRFRKDMWQDWMLSAMMGAAKRVERRKRIAIANGELIVEPVLDATGEANAQGSGLVADNDDELRRAMRNVDQVDDASDAQAEADAEPVEGEDTTQADEMADALAAELESEIADAVTQTLRAQTVERTQRASEAAALAAAEAAMREASLRQTVNGDWVAGSELNARATAAGAAVHALYPNQPVGPRYSQPNVVTPPEAPVGAVPSSPSAAGGYPPRPQRPISTAATTASSVAPSREDSAPSATPDVIAMPAPQQSPTETKVTTPSDTSEGLPLSAPPTFRTSIRRELPEHVAQLASVTNGQKNGAATVAASRPDTAGVAKRPENKEPATTSDDRDSKVVRVTPLPTARPASPQARHHHALKPCAPLAIMIDAKSEDISPAPAVQPARSAAAARATIAPSAVPDAAPTVSLLDEDDDEILDLPRIISAPSGPVEPSLTVTQPLPRETTPEFVSHEPSDDEEAGISVPLIAARFGAASRQE